MKGNLLVIDDKSQSDRFSRNLEQHGYSCFHARGPLTVRALLEENAIALIVWRENSESSELAQDLFRVWADYPGVPVLHLFPDKNAPPLPRPSPFSDSLPAATSGQKLVEAVNHLISQAKAAWGEENLPRSELAFRHLFSRLRRWGQRPRPRNPTGGGLSPAEGFPTAGTALNPAERQMLAAVGRAASPPENSLGPLAQFLRRIAARLPGL